MIVVMEGVRKFGLWLSALIIGPAVVIAVVAFAFSRTMARPTYIKQAFVEAKVYTALGNFLQDELGKSDVGSNKTIQNALTNTITETRLKTVVESAVDGAYAVLNGDVKAKDFSVDASSVKDAFATNLDSAVKKQLAKLPACTSLSSLDTKNILSATCLPAGTNLDKVVAKARDEALGSNELLKTGQIKINNLNEDSDKAQSSNPVEDLQRVADIYRMSKLVLPVAAFFSVLSAVGVVVLSKSHLKGGRRLGTLLLGNALVLAIVSFIARTLAQNLPINNAEGSLMPTTAFEIAGQHIAIDFSTLILKIGLIVFAIGLVTAIAMGILIAKYEPKAKTENNEDKAPKNEPPLDIKTPSKSANKEVSKKK